MHIEDATKEQLITICLWEDCPNDIKFEAARDLQIRKWHDDYLLDLLRFWGEGKSSFQIAIELGVDKSQVDLQLQKYDLYGRRLSRGSNQTFRTAKIIG